jgi:serine/threonine protein phosphatase PrpC
VPDVQIIDLSPKDRFLVLASDGLWDEMNRKQSAIVASNLAKDPVFELNAKTLSNKLLSDALDIAAKKHGLSRTFLGQVRPGP